MAGYVLGGFTPGRVMRRTGAVLLLAALGCQKPDAIESYAVPRAEQAAPPPVVPAAPDAAAKEYRILGAIFPADEPAWFFKMVGSAEQVAKADPLFDQVVASVRFPDGLDHPPQFDVPEGAKLGGGRSVMGIAIHETIQFQAAGIEATITASRGGLLPNLDRWAGQVGRDTITAATIGTVSEPIQARGVKGLKVNLLGPKNPAARGMGGPFSKGR